MPDFVKPSGTTEPFGRREFLRSTNPKPQTESYTLAASTVRTQTIDGNAEKILQPGTVLAKITSGPDAGKVGPYSTDTTGVTDGRSDAANLVGLNLTFLPWQTLERDVEVSVVYTATAVQAWCSEYIAGPDEQSLSDATADALRGTKRLDILFA